VLAFLQRRPATNVSPRTRLAPARAAKLMASVGERYRLSGRVALCRALGCQSRLPARCGASGKCQLASRRWAARLVTRWRSGGGLRFDDWRRCDGSRHEHFFQCGPIWQFRFTVTGQKTRAPRYNIPMTTSGHAGRHQWQLGAHHDFHVHRQKHTETHSRGPFAFKLGDDAQHAAAALTSAGGLTQTTQLIAHGEHWRVGAAAGGESDRGTLTPGTKPVRKRAAIVLLWMTGPQSGRRKFYAQGSRREHAAECPCDELTCHPTVRWT